MNTTTTTTTTATTMNHHHRNDDNDTHCYYNNNDDDDDDDIIISNQNNNEIEQNDHDNDDDNDSNHNNACLRQPLLNRAQSTGRKIDILFSFHSNHNNEKERKALSSSTAIPIATRPIFITTTTKKNPRNEQITTSKNHSNMNHNNIINNNNADIDDCNTSISTIIHDNRTAKNRNIETTKLSSSSSYIETKRSSSIGNHHQHHQQSASTLPSFFASTKPKLNSYHSQQQQQPNSNTTTTTIHIIQPTSTSLLLFNDNNNNKKEQVEVQHQQQRYIIPPSPKERYDHMMMITNQKNSSNNNNNNNNNNNENTIFHSQPHPQRRKDIVPKQEMVFINDDSNNIDDDGKKEQPNDDRKKDNNDDSNETEGVHHDDDEKDIESNISKQHEYSFFMDQSSNSINPPFRISTLMTMNDLHTNNDDDHDHNNDAAGSNHNKNNNNNYHEVFHNANSIAIVPKEDNHHSNTTNTIPVWEEEATPSETAFGKMLLYQRKLDRNNNNNNDDNDDDILSTASEHGSFIMNNDNEDSNEDYDNDDDTDNAAYNNQDEHNDKHDVTKVIGVKTMDMNNNIQNDTSSSTVYQTPSQDEPTSSNETNDNDDNSNNNNDNKMYSNPILMDDDENNEMDLSNTNAPIASSNSVHIDDNADEMIELYTNTNNHNNNNSRGSNNMNTGTTVTKKATDMLYNTIQRFNIGTSNTATITNSNNDSNHDSSIRQQKHLERNNYYNRISCSAPTTPRTNTNYISNTSTTTSNIITSDSDKKVSPKLINQEKVLPSSSTTTASAATASSFLLRSPGSIPYQSAKKSSSLLSKSNKYQKISTVTPWFGKPSNHIAKREANDVNPKHNHNNDNESKKFLSSTNPFHLVARSCFSFDAYNDTSVDYDDDNDNENQRYKYTIPNDDNSLQYTTTVSTSMDDNVHDGTSPSSLNDIQCHLPMPTLDHPTIHPLSSTSSSSSKPVPSHSLLKQDTLSSSTSSIFKKRSVLGQKEINYSASWDVTTSTSTTTASTISPMKMFPMKHNNKTRTLFRSNNTSPIRNSQPFDNRNQMLFRQSNPWMNYSNHSGNGTRLQSNQIHFPSSLSASSSFSPTRRRFVWNRTHNDYQYQRDKILKAGTSNTDHNNNYGDDQYNNTIDTLTYHDGNDPSIQKKDSEVIQHLKSPQRIEIERDDAIDILACLVERGVSFKQQKPLLNDTTHNSEDDAHAGVEKDNIRRHKNTKSNDEQKQNLDPKNNSSGDVDDDAIPSHADIASIVEELQRLSLAEENFMDYNNKTTVAHQKRKLALEELLRSHEYAMEMKRASQSASSWLKSIGRSQSSSPNKTTTSVAPVSSPARNVILSESTTPLSNLSPRSQDDDVAYNNGETSNRAVNTITIAGSASNHQQAAGEESSASDNIDLLTMKAMLHSAQMEVKEKTDLADRLNEELAKCRAEIGRLKSSAQSMSFRSPNRSILDESDDAIEDNDDEINAIIDHTTQEVLKQGKSTTLMLGIDNRILDDNDDCLDSSFLREDGLENGNAAVDAPDIERYKAALNEANASIRQLYTYLQKYSDEFVAGKEPIVTIQSYVGANKMNTEKQFPENNVEMLEIENFTTEWVDLTPPLPNPPDHDLESPIVAAVLELWTSDRALQGTLLDWIDQVLSGSDIDTVPPLTLSSLDNQARDGLLLHVLPFLLRRPDVLVNVKSRAHRRTTYDLSVQIDHAVQPSHDSSTQSHPIPQPFNSNITTTGTPSHITTNSLATFNSKMNVHGDDNYYGTLSTPRSNNNAIIPAMSRLSYDEMAEDIVVSDTSQPGLMSTLGNALGGLLLPTRNNNIHRTNIVVDTTTNDDDYNMNDTAVVGEPSYLIVPPSSRRSIMNGTNMPTIMESPKTTTTLSDYTSNDDVVRFVEMDHDTAAYSNQTKHQHNNNNTVDQPYHRVVSAPPGRIGITFIDYRGHCTVSDVYHDSPLIGWIFPSDILIMIDDIPVSGMPIRDIIKLLKDRSINPQRALRVISSHAMNELTLNASVIVNDATAG